MTLGYYMFHFEVSRSTVQLEKKLKSGDKSLVTKGSIYRTEILSELKTQSRVGTEDVN